MVIKINLAQLITMLNGNTENENRHRPECMKFVVLFNIIQLLPLNEINMRFYGAEYNNIVVHCSIKPYIDQVQV